MRTKRIYRIVYDCQRNCYVCTVHEFPTHSSVSEFIQPPYHSSSLRGALEYFRSAWNVGYNRITFDAIDDLLKKL